MNGGLLKKLLFEKNISQKELGAKIGVSESTLSRWITGKSSPTTTQANQICSILSVSDDHLKASLFLL